MPSDDQDKRMNPLEGKQIKQYRLERLIGEGGMGAVYRATDVNLGRPVAVKLILPQLLHIQSVRDRFFAEARLQAHLNHPGIVSVLDFDPTEGAIVMEHVEGINLHQFLTKYGDTVALDLIKTLFTQVLEAVAFAHGFRDESIPNGVIHRDIKPDNILIIEAGRQRIAKVTDFGIARAYDSAQRLTATGSHLGTVCYMSPEQVRDPRSADVRSDIYSLGVTLYESLTGRVPFDGKSDFEVMRQIVDEPPPPPSRLNHVISAPLQAVLMCAMAKEPADRFENCDAFLEAFERALTPAAPGLSPKESMGKEAGKVEGEMPSSSFADPYASNEEVEVRRSGSKSSPELDDQGVGKQIPLDRLKLFLKQLHSRVDKALAETPLSGQSTWVIGGTGICLILALIWLLGTMGGFSDANRKAEIDGVIRAWIQADADRDAWEVAGYYAPKVNAFGRVRSRRNLQSAKAKSHSKFDLQTENRVSNIEVELSGDGRFAVATFDLLANWTGRNVDPFYCDIRKRVQLTRYSGEWKIVCEEDFLIREASNPQASGTDYCGLD